MIVNGVYAMLAFLPPPDPVAFTVFGLEIRWYGVLISLGMLMASVFVMKKAKAIDVSENDVMDLALVCLPSAIVGARLYYVLFYDFAFYLSHPSEILNVRGGGLAIHGGVIAGVLAGWIFVKRRKLPFLKLIDLVAPGLIFAQGLGRWGNYFNQEAHGGPTDLPWGIIVGGERVHPTFLYESIWNFGVAFYLMWLLNRKRFDGQLICLYMMLYSGARFFIEGLRTDSLMVGPFRTAQVVSLLWIAIGGGAYYFLGKRQSKSL